MVVALRLLLPAVLLVVRQTRRRRKRRRRKRRRYSFLFIGNVNVTDLVCEQEESDDDMGFGLFD